MHFNSQLPFHASRTRADWVPGEIPAEVRGLTKMHNFRTSLNLVSETTEEFWSGNRAISPGRQFSKRLYMRI